MKRFFILLLLVTSVFVLKAQENSGNVSGATNQHNVKKSRRAVSKDKVHFGTASFYANKFEGRKTANGEIFSQKKFSAASNILPLDHWVRVTNQRNKLFVILRITDRMHKNNKRLIDLSKAAARKLKYTGYGLARVKVEVLGKRLPEGIARD
jgi:rare lipoprotein A